MLAVEVANLLLYVMQSLTTVHLTLFVSILLGWSVTTIKIYVAFLFACFWWWGMTNIVLVPVGMQEPTLYASLKKSVAFAYVQLAPSLPLRRALISHIFPVAASSAAPAK